MDSGRQQNPHVVIVPSLGMGHLIPMLEMSKRLASDHAYSVTVITLTCNLCPVQLPYAQNYLQSHSLPINFIGLPEVHIHPEKMKPVTLKTKVTQKSATLMENVLKDLLTSFSIYAFVTDIFNTAFLEVTTKMGIPSYIFSPSSASFMSLLFHLPELDSRHDISIKDMETPVEIPGLAPMQSSELPSSVQDRSDPCCAYFLYNCSNLRKAKAVLINTFRHLERPAVEALETGTNRPAVYPIGPIICEGVNEDESPPRCLRWLDRQPARSVVFVSFGSEAVLSSAQITELALGLEASGRRFLWVLRADPAAVLPQGFESRNAERGLVVCEWTPQVAVLSHASTCAFVSHCGWNSTLESIWCGVPIVAWPIQAEQKMNRVLVVKELGVAIEAKMEADGFVAREEVERAVRAVMEAEDVRRRMRELREAAESALRQGGSSHRSLLALVSEWKEGFGPHHCIVF